MILDLVVIAALIISALIAFLRGFIRETLTIVGVVGGFFAALYGGPVLSEFVSTWMDIKENNPEKLFDVIPYPLVADVISYGSIFIMVLLLLSVVSYFISGLASSIGLGPVDRTLGVFFGIARAVILLGLLYLPFHLLLDEEAKDEWFGGSKTFHYVEWTAEALGKFLPEEFDSKKDVENAASQTREKLQKIEVLKQEGEDSGAENKPKKEESKDNTGYEEGQRRQLDELFEDRTQE
jgi:membrane protein required for colicin V production